MRAAAAGRARPPRELVVASHPELRELSSGACGHDGERVRAGAGNHRVYFSVSGFAGDALAYPQLEGAHCGCVEGTCAWFTTP